LPSVIDSINENWYDIVDENIVDALYDRFDCAGILDKNNYGGGSFEALRELQIAVEEKVTDTIKQMYQINENKNSNMNKKALYERIMSQLSIEVKKVLNEKYSDNLLLYYEIINKLLNREKLSIDEINILENAVAIYRGGGKNKIQKLIKLYIEQAGNNCSLNWIDVSRIKDMSEMFSYSNFNGDISKWDVSNVKIMHNMFEGSKFNGDISKWNVSNVERMDFMFGNSIFNGDISKWDVSNVKNMRYMFWHS
jgi:surface protein